MRALRQLRPPDRKILATASPPHLQGICELTRINSTGLGVLYEPPSYGSQHDPIANAVSKPLSTHEVAES
jgi:hypothetical protein